MKIIRKGSKKILTYRFTCEGCDSELEIEPKDLHLSNKYEKKDGSPVLYCKCPVCKRFQYFDRSLLDDFQ